MRDMSERGGENPKPKIGRRSFLKALGLGGMGLMLGGCASGENEKTPVIEGGEGLVENDSVEKLDKGEGLNQEYVVSGELGENIWQEEIEVGESMEMVVGKVAPWNQWEGFSAILVNPDEDKVVHFTGKNGGGKRAMTLMSGFYRQGVVKGYEQYDPYKVEVGSQLVFGNSGVVDKNFGELLGDEEKLKGTSSFMSAKFERKDREDGGWTEYFSLRMVEKRDDLGERWIVSSEPVIYIQKTTSFDSGRERVEGEWVNTPKEEREKKVDY